MCEREIHWNIISWCTYLVIGFGFQSERNRFFFSGEFKILSKTWISLSRKIVSRKGAFGIELRSICKIKEYPFFKLHGEEIDYTEKRKEWKTVCLQLECTSRYPAHADTVPICLLPTPASGPF